MGCKTLARFNFDNATVATLAENGNVQFSSGTISNDCVSYDGSNITINRSGVYLILFNATFVATATGTVESQMYRNGNAVPGAHAIDTVAAVGDFVSQAYHALVTVPRNGSDTVINFRTPTATSERIANAIIVKVA